MSLNLTYKKLLVEQYLKDAVASDKEVSGEDILAFVNQVDGRDYSTPQFKAAGKTVGRLEAASASKQTNTYQLVRQDLLALYTEMMRLAKVAMDASDRWTTEVHSIEKDLIDLDDEVSALLLRAQDTDGYYSTIVDNFTDTSLIDTAYTDCGIDVVGNFLSLSATRGTRQVIPLDLIKDDQVSFKVTSVNTGVSAPNLKNIFIANQGQGSQITVTTAHSISVNAELNIKLYSKPISISQIVLTTRNSSGAGPLQITPLYLTSDNINYLQLPGVTVTQAATGDVTFVFPSITTTTIKLILSKQGPDAAANGVYSYEFGFKNIQFLHNTFDISTTETYISEPLFVVDHNGDAQQFRRLSLETCEQIEKHTSINYFVTTSNDPAMPVDTAVWSPVSPVNQDSPKFTTVLDVSSNTIYEFGTSGLDVKLSYNINGVVSGHNSFRNPAATFQIITSGLSGVTTTSGLTTSGQRFFAGNPDNYILNYQVDDTVLLDPRSIELFRNVGQQGLSTISGQNTVRGDSMGWKFNPITSYWECVIQVSNPLGMTMDIGPCEKGTEMIIDGSRYSGSITSAILTGETAASNGVHSVQVHSNYWEEIPSGITSLANLKSVHTKTKYPYNQKYLIEGYVYGTGWPTSDEQVYIGADLFAESLMKEVSPFDMLSNVPSNSLQYFAQDHDIANSHNGGNTPNTVFVVKVNREFADFINERFVLKFKLTDQLRQYLRLKAEFKTDVATATPIFHGYKIKLGN